MKYLLLASIVLSLGSAVSGTPISEKRQQTSPIQAITNSLDILKASAGANEGALAAAITNAKSNANAGVSIAASVNADFQAIANGFATAAASITSELSAAASGIAGQGQALSQAEINDLEADLQTLGQIVSGVRASINLETTDLSPAAKAAVTGEANAVKAAIAPVVNPIMDFANAASKASAKAGDNVAGLSAAYAGVQSIVGRFAATNGLPGINFPGITLG